MNSQSHRNVPGRRQQNTPVTHVPLARSGTWALGARTHPLALSSGFNQLCFFKQGIEAYAIKNPVLFVIKNILRWLACNCWKEREVATRIILLLRYL